MLQESNAPSHVTPDISLIFSEKKTRVSTYPPVSQETKRVLMKAANEKRKEFDPLEPGQFVCMDWTPIGGLEGCFSGGPAIGND